MKRTINRSEVLQELESMKKLSYRDPIMKLMRTELDAVILRLGLAIVIPKKIKKEETEITSIAKLRDAP